MTHNNSHQYSRKSVLWFLIILIAWISMIGINQFLYNPHYSLFSWLFSHEQARQSYPNAYVYQKETLPPPSTSAFSHDQLLLYTSYCHHSKLRCKIMPFQSTIAALTRIRHIQYAGRHIQRSAIPHFFDVIDTITALEPYREYPYIFTQILWPINKTSDRIPYREREKSWLRTARIGERGFTYLCEGEVCPSYQLPHTLAFNYFQYIQQPTKAAYFYEVAGQHDDAPLLAAQMSAIVLGRLGQHLTSASAWYDKYLTALTREIETGEIPESDNPYVKEDSTHFFHKALFEFSLHLIAQTDSALDITTAGEDCLHDIQCLITDGHITKTIIDLQQDCTTMTQQSATTLFMQCDLLAYGLQKWYLKRDGSMVYPFNDNATNKIYTYERRQDIGEWRVRPMRGE